MYFDEKLKQLRQQADWKRRLEGELANLRVQRQDLAGKVWELAKQKNAEQADVDRLEGHSLAAFCPPLGARRAGASGTFWAGALYGFLVHADHTVFFHGDGHAVCYIA